jgi:hypothetical protein
MGAMRLVVLLLAAGLLSNAADNALTPDEKQSGWQLLFDGRSMKGWQDPMKKAQPGDAWEVVSGTLKTRLKPRISEDLITEESYGDFELKFDWKLSPRGNTGVKYRLQKEIFVDNSKIQPGPGAFEGMLGREIANPQSDRSKLAPDAKAQVYTVAFEFQLLDDQLHPDARKDSSHQTGALYSMIPAEKRAAKPAGEWNSSRLVLKGSHFEHWVNGTRVLEGSLDDARVKQGAEKRWAKWAPSIYQALTKPKPRGPIALQHHGDEVWFKNIKIRELN